MFADDLFENEPAAPETVEQGGVTCGATHDIISTIPTAVFPTLTVLDLSHQSISWVEANVFSALTVLESLILHDNQLFNLAWLKTCGPLPNLWTLDVSANNLVDIRAVAETHAVIGTLKLHHNPIDPQPAMETLHEVCCVELSIDCLSREEVQQCAVNAFLFNGKRLPKPPKDTMRQRGVKLSQMSRSGKFKRPKQADLLAVAHSDAPDVRVHGYVLKDRLDQACLSCSCPTMEAQLVDPLVTLIAHSRSATDGDEDATTETQTKLQRMFQREASQHYSTYHSSDVTQAIAALLRPVIGSPPASLPLASERALCDAPVFLHYWRSQVRTGRAQFFLNTVCAKSFFPAVSPGTMAGVVRWGILTELATESGMTQHVAEVLAEAVAMLPSWVCTALLEHLGFSTNDSNRESLRNHYAFAFFCDVEQCWGSDYRPAGQPTISQQLRECAKTHSSQIQVESSAQRQEEAKLEMQAAKRQAATTICGEIVQRGTLNLSQDRPHTPSMVDRLVVPSRTVIQPRVDTGQRSRAEPPNRAPSPGTPFSRPVSRLDTSFTSLLSSRQGQAGKGSDWVSFLSSDDMRSFFEQGGNWESVSPVDNQRSPSQSPTRGRKRRLTPDVSNNATDEVDPMVTGLSCVGITKASPASLVQRSEKLRKERIVMSATLSYQAALVSGSPPPPQKPMLKGEETLRDFKEGDLLHLLCGGHSHACCIAHVGNEQIRVVQSIKDPVLSPAQQSAKQRKEHGQQASLSLQTGHSHTGPGSPDDSKPAGKETPRSSQLKPIDAANCLTKGRASGIVFSHCTPYATGKKLEVVPVGGFRPSTNCVLHGAVLSTKGVEVVVDRRFALWHCNGYWQAPCASSSACKQLLINAGVMKAEHRADTSAPCAGRRSSVQRQTSSEELSLVKFVRNRVKAKQAAEQEARDREAAAEQKKKTRVGFAGPDGTQGTTDADGSTESKKEAATVRSDGTKLAESHVSMDGSFLMVAESSTSQRGDGNQDGNNQPAYTFPHIPANELQRLRGVLKLQYNVTELVAQLAALLTRPLTAQTVRAAAAAGDMKLDGDAAVQEELRTERERRRQYQQLIQTAADVTKILQTASWVTAPSKRCTAFATSVDKAMSMVVQTLDDKLGEQRDSEAASPGARGLVGPNATTEGPLRDEEVLLGSAGFGFVDVTTSLLAPVEANRDGTEPPKGKPVTEAAPVGPVDKPTTADHYLGSDRTDPFPVARSPRLTDADAVKSVELLNLLQGATESPEASNDEPVPTQVTGIDTLQGDRFGVQPVARGARKTLAAGRKKNTPLVPRAGSADASSWQSVSKSGPSLVLGGDAASTQQDPGRLRPRAGSAPESSAALQHHPFIASAKQHMQSQRVKQERKHARHHKELSEVRPNSAQSACSATLGRLRAEAKISGNAADAGRVVSPFLPAEIRTHLGNTSGYSGIPQQAARPNTAPAGAALQAVKSVEAGSLGVSGIQSGTPTHKRRGLPR